MTTQRQLFTRDRGRDRGRGRGRDRGRGRGRGLLLALLLALACAPAAARADAALEAAKRHNAAAKQLFAAGKYEQAAAAYQRAYDAKPLPTFLYNIGQCHRRLGTVEGLRAALRFFERHQREAPDSPNKQVVQGEIEEVRRELATKEREAAPAAPVASQPAATSQPTRPEPAPKPAPAPTATGAPGGDETAPPPPSRPLYRRPWLWTAVGALASLGAGLGLGLAARSDYQRAEELGLGQQAANRPAWEETVDGGKAKALGANVLFGLSGALAATTVVLFLLEGPDEQQEGAARSVRLVPAAAGLSLQGSF